MDRRRGISVKSALRRDVEQAAAVLLFGRWANVIRTIIARTMLLQSN